MGNAIMEKLHIMLVGYGVVGKQTAKVIRENTTDLLLTVDMNPDQGADYISVRNYIEYVDSCDFTENVYPDVFLICVWSPEQILDVLKELKPLIDRYENRKPLISIESTTVPGTYALARSIIGDDVDMVIFQERIYPNDDQHGVMNQKRVMGGDWKRGREFYLRYMIYENIVVSDNILAVELSHILDNSWRYIQIAAAQELAMLVGEENYPELRRLVNSKWNLDMPEVREGIGGHCLPRDILLMNQTFPNNEFFNVAERLNDEFKKLKEDKHGEITKSKGY